MAFPRLVTLAGLLTILALSPGQAILARDIQHDIDHVVRQSWQTEQGLPQSSVTSILQTRDGYIWVGTFGGVARFDGVRFTVFDAGNTPGILNNRILDLFEDRSGTLWVATEGGLSRYEHGRWSTLSPADGLQGATVFSVTQDGDGVMWAGTDRGLSAIRNGVVVHGAWEAASVNALSYVTSGRQGEVWAVVGGRLLHITHGTPVEMPFAVGHRESAHIVLYESRDRALWVGFDDGTFRRGEDGQWTSIVQSGPAAQRIPSSAISEDANGRIVLASNNDVWWWRGGQLERRQVINGAGDYLRTIREDRDGDLWFGSDRSGLQVWRRSRVIALGAADGFPEASAVPVLEDRVGRIWVSAPCKDLRAVPVGSSQAPPVTITHIGCVWTLVEDPSGDMWAGNFGTGVYRISNGKVVAHLTTKDGLAGNGINALFIDRSGALWVGAQRGVSRIANGRVTTIPLSVEDTSIGVHFITEDRSGAIWIAARGLIRVVGDSIQRFTTDQGLSNNAVRVIREDPDGVMWIGTYGGGLNRFKNGKFSVFSTQNGLIDNTVSMVLDDGRGNLWLNGNAGITRVARKDLDDVADGRRARLEVGWLGTADGMKSREGNGGGQPAGWRSRDGRMWFPTLAGVVVIDANESLPAAPSVLIESAHAGERALDLTAPTRVEAGADKFEFAYTAFAYRNPTSLRFKFRLDGYDRDWVDAGDRREAFYTNLPPRAYRFHVIARSNDGIWSETGASVSFVLAPHFYQTAWFRALAALALLVVAFTSYQFSVRRLRARADTLAGLVEQRTRAEAALRSSNAELESAMVQLRQAQQTLVQQERIRALGQMASGIAHDINNSLAPILGYSDLLLSSGDPKHDPQLVPALRSINTSAQDAAGVVRRLIQFYRRRLEGSVFPAVELGPLVEQVVSLTQPRWKTDAQSRGATITVEQHIPNLPSVAADPSELREALINIVFNAVEAMPTGGTIRFSAVAVDDGVALSVSDSGIGMTDEERQKCFEPFFSTKGDLGTGLGLATVFGAIQRFSGTISVTSAPGKGTTFTITLPMFAAGPDAVPQEVPAGPVAPMRVFVVDDEPTVRRLIAMYLTGDGHTVETAMNGRDGLDRFVPGAFDLVITDRAMPVMSGVQMAEEIHRIDPDVPIILLSGYGDIMTATGDLPHGVSRVLSKPVSLREFRQALADVRRRP